MSTPTLWNKTQIFYPIGNTSPVLLTQDLSLEQRADLLLLGCGDPRHILYTLYAEEDRGRKYDFTCCDSEPAVLARNILLLTLIIDGNTPNVLWDVFYHYKIDKKTLDALTSQSQKLLQHSLDLTSWSSSPYAPFINFSSQSTLLHLHSYWSKYAEAVRFTNSRHQQYLTKIRNDFGSIDVKLFSNLTGARSAGHFWHAALEEVSRNTARYWHTGFVHKDDQDRTSNATFVNPTFVYSTAGDACAVHNGTYPLQSFHLTEVYASTSEKLVTEEQIIECATKQFERWCKSFQAVIASGRCVLRFFVGDAMLFCQALRHHQTTGSIRSSLNISSWSGEELVLDGGDYDSGSDRPAPKTFNVIDTSNLISSLGLLNVVVGAAPLLVPHPSATLYTETRLKEKDMVDMGFLRRLCTDLPTFALLTGVAPVACVAGFTSSTNVSEKIKLETLEQAANESKTQKQGTAGFDPSAKQYQERTAWRSVTSNLPQSTTIAFDDSKALAQILHKIYYEMMKYEDITAPGPEPTTITINGKKYQTIDSTLEFHRGSFVFFLALCKSHLHCDWDQTMKHLMQLLHNERRLMYQSENFQQLCTQLHLRGVYSVGAFTSRTAIRPTGVFAGWASVPEVVCIVLTVPRSSLKVLEDMKPNELGNPMLEGVVRGSQHHTFSDVQFTFGRIVMNSGKVEIEEDETGFLGSSPLIATFLVPAHIIEDSKIGLKVFCAPGTEMVLMRKLGMLFSIFAADYTDRGHIHILPHRPHRPHLVQDLRIVLPDKPKRIPATVTASSTLELSVRWDIKDKAALAILPQAVVEKEQTAVSTISVTMNSKPAHDFFFPFPIDNANARVRIARKSKYIEVVAPIAWPPFDYRVQDFNGRLLAFETPGSPLPWSIHSVPLDRLPPMKHSALKNVVRFRDHFLEAFTNRERETRRLQETGDVLLNVKDTISGIFTNSAEQEIDYLVLNDSQRKPFVVLFINSISLDVANQTFVADVCILPLTVDFGNNAEARKWYRLLCVNNDQGGAMELTPGEVEQGWVHLLPAFVERCRTWKHKSTCEYKKPRATIPLGTGRDDRYLCSCGEGVDLGRCGTKVEWDPLSKYMTRAAISTVFALPYLDTPRTMPDARFSCGFCLKERSPDKLMLCSRCKMIKYCDSKCQRAHWKKHKNNCYGDAGCNQCLLHSTHTIKNKCFPCKGFHFTMTENCKGGTKARSLKHRPKKGNQGLK